MTAISNISVRSYCDRKKATGVECDCCDCQRARGVPEPVEYVFTQELMDEYNHYKELVDTLIKRVQTLESGEGF